MIFLDARDAPQYQGCISGAHLLDPYRPEQGLAAVLPVPPHRGPGRGVLPGGRMRGQRPGGPGLLLDSGVPAEKLQGCTAAATRSGWSTANPWSSDHRPTPDNRGATHDTPVAMPQALSP